MGCFAARASRASEIIGDIAPSNAICFNAARRVPRVDGGVAAHAVARDDDDGAVARVTVARGIEAARMARE
jgi:hypothetical protein